MNRSWRNTSANSSTGFVYFNTSNSFSSPNSQNRLDTPEFLSFGSDSSPGSSPHANRFSPTNYSSPRKPYSGRSPRQFGGGRNHYYSPVRPTRGKYWRKDFGLTGSAEKNVNNDKNYQNYQNRHHHKHRHSLNQPSSSQTSTTSAFYDPTCLQDPWAELEQKLAEKKKMQDDSLLEPKPSQSVDGEAVEMDTSGESSSEDGSEEIEESFS